MLESLWVALGSENFVWDTSERLSSRDTIKARFPFPPPFLFFCLNGNLDFRDVMLAVTLQKLIDDVEVDHARAKH
jgi:hypothetical protein